MEWALLPLKRYAQFEGRSRRKEYWLFYLLTLAAYLAGSLIDIGIGIPVVGPLACLALLIPSLAVGFRRLHDTGRRAWWLLIGFVPIIGAIVLIVFFATKGQAGPNKYGADPLADDAPAAEPAGTLAS